MALQRSRIFSIDSPEDGANGGVSGGVAGSTVGGIAVGDDGADGVAGCADTSGPFDGDSAVRVMWGYSWLSGPWRPLRS